MLLLHGEMSLLAEAVELQPHSVTEAEEAVVAAVLAVLAADHVYCLI